MVIVRLGAGYLLAVGPWEPLGVVRQRSGLGWFAICFVDGIEREMEDVLSGGVRREMREMVKADGGDCVMNAFIEKRSMNCTGTAMSTVPEPCRSAGRAVRGRASHRR